MSTAFDNKWRQWPAPFEITNLDNYMGMRDGFQVMPGILDPAVGEEILLVVRDQTPFMQELRQVEPFRLIMKTGLSRNDFGPLVFFLFWVENPVNPAEPFAAWDYYLNPKNDGMMRRLLKLASQTHWHLTLVGEGGRQENYFEFENHYGLAEALDFAKEATSNIGMVDFNRAKDLFMQKYTVDDLFRMGTPGHEPVLASNAGSAEFFRRKDEMDLNWSNMNTEEAIKVLLRAGAVITFSEQQRHLSLRLAAAKLDCSVDYLRAHLEEFPNAWRMTGGEIRIPTKDIAAWIKARRIFRS